MSTKRALLALLSSAALAAALAVLSLPACAFAEVEVLKDDGNASWHEEQPLPPPPSPGAQQPPNPIGLGHIGDIEFWAPDRGLLITHGDGSTIPAGVWAYDGERWKELASVCGATDGRIAWEGGNEFWTVSDGRPGQAASKGQGKLPPLEDDTLCHFAGGQVVGSYASLAFRASSYEAMHAAGCIGQGDCWFAGEPLSEELPLKGSFHLHWDGSSVSEEPYEGESQPVQDMRLFQGHLYESVRVTHEARTPGGEEVPVLHLLNPKGSLPLFKNIPGLVVEPEEPPESAGGVPLHVPGEFFEALRSLSLSPDEAGLWGATSGVRATELPTGSTPGQVTVVRYSGEEWTQILGPSTKPSGMEKLPNDVVESIAAEPGTNSAWVALDTESDAEQPSPTASAIVARISSDGAVSDEQTLPSQAEQEKGVVPRGAAAKISCPAAHDCWLATTQGWLFHLTNGQSYGVDEEGFSKLITDRPADQGLPQQQPDAPPEDNSGLLGELPPAFGSLAETAKSPIESLVSVPLLSGIHSRLIHGTTLELRFHLAALARVRLIARRGRSVVASTPTRTLAAGSRKLLLRLNARRWPTKLDLQTHALAPLPTVSTRSAGVESVTTRLAFPNLRSLTTPGSLF
jgi:hypothetical protein